jgi:flagellar biosynthesis chaperone FliJ
MILKKDIDHKYTREIDQAIKDVESIKDQINTLNENDATIEENVNKTLGVFKEQLIQTVNRIAESLNKLIEKNDDDMTKIYEEFTKLYKLVELKEKDYKNLISKSEESFKSFMKKIDSVEGYLKMEGGRVKGVKLPEDRIFDEKFHVETVTEIIREQPIIKEIEKKVTPILTKSMLEHYYDYGTKLSEEVMAPKYIQGYDKLQISRDPEQFYKSDKKIIIFRFIRTLLLIFLDDGTTEITNVAKGTTIYKGNIIKDIRDQLSLDISPMEITAIQPAGSGFFIATKNNGVLHYNIFEKTIASRMSENEVIYIEQYEDKLLLVSDLLSVYNEDDIRVYSNKMFENRFLKPLKVEKLSDGKIAILTGGEQKGLAGLIYLFRFENGELTQKFIYTDPFDRRDIYFYDIVSDADTMTVIGNKDGNYMSYVYDIKKIDERYKIKMMEKEFDLLGVAYNITTNDFLLVFNDKLVLNNKIVYGIDYSENREVIFKDNFAYCIYDTHVERIDVTPSVGKIFKFPITVHGDGQDTKIIIKKEGEGLPLVSVGNKNLNLFTIADYIYISGAVAGDIVELNINGINIDDISIYSEYSIPLE